MTDNSLPPGSDQGAWEMLFSAEFWTVLWLWLAATVGRHLVSDEEFKPRQVLGELTLACVGAVALYAFGVLNGFSPMKIVLIGGGLSLGGVRALSIVGQVVRAVITKSPIA
jgi:hypothetical protein